MREFCLRNTNALIGDRYGQFLPIATHSQGYPSSLGGILQGIAQQIGYRLLQEMGVSPKLFYALPMVFYHQRMLSTDQMVYSF
jgi:hypothetical protein